jgi:PAS domain S-box-containing protein
MKTKHISEKGKNRELVNLPVRILILTVFSIMVTNVIVGYIVSNLAPLKLPIELLVDSILLIIILLPVIYFFEFRPISKSIDDLKREKENTMKSEEKFSKAFMNSSDSVNINRMSDGMFISVNKGFTRILGYTEDDSIGKTSLEMNIWVDPLIREELVKELLQKGNVMDFEADFRRKDGKVVNGLMSASMIEIDGVPHILTETKDVTQNKKISKAFEFEQFLVNALMNNIPDHIYFKDLDSKFIRNNKSHAVSFGLSDPAQAVGKSDFDFFTREAAQQAYDDEQMIIRTGQPVTKEEKLTRIDQSVAWFFAMKMPLRNNKGNIIGTFGISRDITERKRTELENEVIYEIIQGIATTSNLDELLKLIHNSLGKVVYAENCFVALYDQKTGLFSFPYFVDKFDEVPLPTSLGKSCTAFVLRNVKPLLLTQQIFDQLVARGEVELIGSNSPSWIGIPLQTPSKVIGVLVVQHYEKENVYSERDVKFLTSIGSQIAISIDRKKTEEEIKLKNELLQAINAEKDKFFSIIAHDLRGPLSAFVSATQIITEEIQNMTIEEIREITESMKTSATNIYRLLENLLEWSRLMRGGMEFIPVRINLRHKTDECLNVLYESGRKKEIRLDVTIPAGLEIFADIHMFESIMRNLVSNAIKFTGKGGSVEVSAIHNNNNSVEVKVSDSGIGMPAELKERLFHINEKTSRQGTGGEPSTGLGLLLCKEFIEKNGGKIWVESIAEQGSTFYFTLPLSENLNT